MNPSSRGRGAPLVTLALLVASMTAMAMPVQAQSAPSPPNLPPGVPAPANCGWNAPANSTKLVASSPAGSAVVVTIGEPSWQQDCIFTGTPGGGGSTTSFPEYEVFPIAVHASPNTTMTLQTGEAVPTAQQVAEGIQNATLWTWFNPGTVETDSTGMARSNLTLAGAVMPFVPNDIANVTLPIIASASTGQNGSAGLPIEFEGGVSDVLQSVGPIGFGSGISGQAGSPSSPSFAVVYSPRGPSSSYAPLQVSMQVLGTYDNGSIGPLPPDVQVSFPQPSIELLPHSIFYLSLDESNSLQYTNATRAAYTFAVQEKVGNETYVVPLPVSISLMEVIFSGPGSAVQGAAIGASNSTSSTPVVATPKSTSTALGIGPVLGLGLLAFAAVSVAVFLVRRPRPAPG